MVENSCNAPNQSNSNITVAPQETELFRAIGGWLKTVLPVGTVILQGQQNQTPQPLGLYCTMTIITRRRLATNSWYYTETSRIVTEPTEIAVQISIFGTGSGDAVHRVHSMWRDFFTTDYMRVNQCCLSPMFSMDPRQLGFVTAEDQYADGWSVDLHMQVNFQITTPQQFADTVSVPLQAADLSNL